MNEPHDKRTASFDVLMCWLTALSYAGAALFFFLQPAPQRIRIANTFEALLAFCTSYVQDGGGHHAAAHACAFLFAVCALAPVAALADRSDAWRVPHARWLTLLALFGYATFAVSNLRAIGAEPLHAHAIASASSIEARGLAIASLRNMEMERFGFLTYASIGLWVVVLSVRAVRLRLIRPAHAWIGIGFGLANVLMVLDYWPAFQSGAVARAAIGFGAAVLGPAWFVGLGLRFRTAAP